MSRIALVAALEREISPLVRGWNRRSVERDGRSLTIFEKGDIAAICGGIGPEAARRATETILREAKPACVISVGFVGALDPELRIADVFEPRVVVSVEDGSRIDTGSGKGVLVSFGSVAGREQKLKLRKSYAASAIDMEAAAVAQAATLHGVEFAAMKAVSDEVDFEMPTLDKFIAPNGTLQTTKFAVHVALRPWLWAMILRLSRNSVRASRALCGALERHLADPKFCGSSVHSPA